MQQLTPDQLGLFVRLALERRGREAVLFAQAVSVGAVTGVTGSPKPLQALERALLGDAQTASSEIGAQLQGRLKQFARAAKARVVRSQAQQQGG